MHETGASGLRLESRAPGPSPAVEEVACWSAISDLGFRGDVLGHAGPCLSGSRNLISDTISRAGHEQRLLGLSAEVVARSSRRRRLSGCES